MKKLIPALCMLLVSQVLLGTSTFAWFSMNTQVTATGMQVKAQAEGGIVISNESKSDWKSSATASHSDCAELIPTSSEDGSAWYHAVSVDANKAKAKADGSDYVSDDYTSLTCQDSDTDGVYTATLDGDEKGIYLLNKFYIQSSASQIDLSDRDTDNLLINDVQVSGTGTSATLDKSLRVMITIGETTVIYAPVSGATLTYNVDASEDSVTCLAGTEKNVETGISTIPAYTSNGANAIEASLYIYFEGEDPECKSANITATLDTLQVTVRFGTTAIS